MTTSSHSSGLHGLIDTLEAMVHDRETVTLGDIVDALGARGHGPIILILAAFMMLPTGMIPFMPTIIGIVMMLTAVEMLIGREGVAIPGRLARFELRGDLLRSALRRAHPATRWLSRWLYPRASHLVTSSLAIVLIAVILILAAGVMAVIGGIPGLPLILCAPALLFGLGLTAGDGLVVGAGFATAGGAVAAIAAIL